ncbi:MAG TPA: BTAD domain-containing putative transcriptional regulator [Thermoanaerobaculia bacterium]
MMETAHLLPHLERLLRRIELADTFLVQVWGWPGSGKSALLASFLASQGRSAAGLSLGELADPAEVRRAVESAHAAGARWLVASGGPDSRLTEAARWLRPGQLLVFATERRWEGEEALPGSIVPPQELLLGVEEIASLWALLTGFSPGPDAIHRLQQASDGWYRPLQLALEATGGAGLDVATPEQLLEIPPVRHFLRHEILGSLSPEDFATLLSAPAERPANGQDWRLIDERGLWVEGEERDRMPRLLASWLDRERRRRGVRSEAEPPRPVPSQAGEPEDRPTFVLGLLGPPFAKRREADGDRDLDCRLRRSFQVLAYLASSPGLEAGREDLIEAVWPTEGERTIERNFHPTLSHLRRALEAGQTLEVQPLLFRGGVYRLNPEIGWEIDVLDFQRLAEKGKELLGKGEIAEAAEVWRQAWSLYRGPFLQGHYDPWVAARREIYQRLHLEMLRDLGDLYLKLDRPDEAMDAYRSVLVEDPLQERIHVALMNLYASQGRRDMVRRQYDRLCTLLLEELGVEPLAETTREYHRLMG